jgi:hypothetical protein
MARRAVVLAVLIAAIAVVLVQPPIPQDPRYHELADRRALLGIPNALDVLSNLPFALVGLVGLAATLRLPAGWLRWPYAAFFGGVLLTAFGSAYYHLAPGNARLVWDRLPMTLAFMGLLAAVVAERVSERLSRWLLVPLLAAGAFSVLYWYRGELRGAGDLRPYALVQFGSLLLIVLLLLLYRGGPGGTAYLAAGLAVYGAAKALEWADAPIFELGRVVSGHTLKHLAAAAGAGAVAAMVRRRGRV